MSNKHRAHGAPRSSGALLWISGAIAVVVLSLGASGTMASWTTATVTNSTNTTATGDAVILTEKSGSVSCSSAEQASNTSTCTTINKYGGTTTALMPGDSHVTDVVFTNSGVSNASSFSMSPGACSSTPSTGTPTPTNLCTVTGELTVGIACRAGADWSTGTDIAALTWAPVAPGSLTTKTYSAAPALAAGSSLACRVTVALSSTASVNSQGVTVSQPLTWTLAR